MSTLTPRIGALALAPDLPLSPAPVSWYLFLRLGLGFARIPETGVLCNGNQRLHRNSKQTYTAANHHHYLGPLRPLPKRRPRVSHQSTTLPLSPVLRLAQPTRVDPGKRNKGNGRPQTHERPRQPGRYRAPGLGPGCTPPPRSF